MCHLFRKHDTRSYLINRFSLEWTFTPGAKRLISRGFGMLGLKPRPPKTIYEIGSSIHSESEWESSLFWVPATMSQPKTQE